jgi:hypothetical protein
MLRPDKYAITPKFALPNKKKDISKFIRLIFFINTHTSILVYYTNAENRGYLAKKSEETTTN